MNYTKIFILIATLLGITACQTSKGNKVFRIGYAMAPGGTSHLGALKIQELVKEKSQGTIEVKLYPGGILGKEGPLIEGLQLKSVDMVIAGPSIIGNYAPKYGMIEAPFLFRSYEHLDKILYGPIGKEIENAVSKYRGLHFIDFFPSGTQVSHYNR